MANEPTLTVVGNLTADPELRFTPSGHPVANFTIAQTPRTFNRQSNEWEEGETLFIRCSVWRRMAENVAETLMKGTRTIVTGRLLAKSFQTRDGETRTNWELDVDEVGPSLRYATAQVTRNNNSNNAGGGFTGNTAGWQQHGNPWDGQTTAGGEHEEPPF